MHTYMQVRLPPPALLFFLSLCGVLLMNLLSNWEMSQLSKNSAASVESFLSSQNRDRLTTLLSVLNKNRNSTYVTAVRESLDF